MGGKVEEEGDVTRIKERIANKIGANKHRIEL